MFSLLSVSLQPPKAKPPLERTQSFSHYEEMRAKPDGASNPITPPRSSREDIAGLPERFAQADQFQKRPEGKVMLEFHLIYCQTVNLYMGLIRVQVNIHL